MNTLASVAMNVAFLFVGVVFDKFGTLVTRTVCTFLITIGLVLLIFIEANNYLVFPGIMFYSAGSFSLSLTNLPLSQVWFEKKKRIFLQFFRSLKAVSKISSAYYVANVCNFPAFDINI